MPAKSNAKWTVRSLLMLMLWVSCGPLAQAVTAPSDFKFGDVDLKVLAEAIELDRQFERKGMVIHDPELTAYLESVGKQLLGNDPPPERVEFKFRVLRDPLINAFALPNGSIYVNSGLLALLDNESELASVLGHEITHVLNRHTYLFNRSVRKKTVVINVLSGVAAVTPGGSVVGASIRLATTLSEAIVATTIFGYSQDMEREADRNGMNLLVRAGYDPYAMPRTFELLDERLEFEPVEGIYRSHPKVEERRRSAQEMADARGLKGMRMGTEGDYLSVAAPAITYNIQADLNSRRARTALARAKKLERWKPDAPAYQVLVADAYRSLGAKTAQPSEEESGRHGQAEHRKRYFQLTEEEEQKELLSKPGGPEERRANEAKAAKIYLETVGRNPEFAPAHRGLGFLYEQQSRSSDAAKEYRRYLELTPADAMDRFRIEGRLKAIEKITNASAVR